MAGELLKADRILKIGQRVEFYLEKDDTKYTSRIEDVEADHLVVAMPMDEKRRPILPEKGEKLYGLAVGEGCRYRFFTIYLDKAAQPIPVWKISRPEVVERQQNRSFVRVAVTLPIKFRSVDDEGKLGEEQEAYTLDLSGSGVSFVWKEPIPPNHKAALEINNLPEIGTLQIMARVVRCVQLEPKTRGYHMGMHFLNLPRATMNKLVRYIFVLQREQLAKGLSVSGVSK